MAMIKRERERERRVEHVVPCSFMAWWNSGIARGTTSWQPSGMVRALASALSCTLSGASPAGGGTACRGGPGHGAPLQAPRPPPRPLHRPHGAPREHRARDRRPHKHQRPLVTCGEDDHPHRSSHSLAYRSSYPRSQSSLLPATAITRSAAVRSRKRRGELIGGMLTTGCLLLCLSAHHPAVIYIYI